MLDLFARQAADFIESLRITEQLRDADRRKDEFIATLSHELRNPLAAIDSAAMLLESVQLDSAKRDWTIQVVRRQCRTMKILLDDLLDVTRFTLGRVTLKKQTLTLASLIDSAVETTQSLMDGEHRPDPAYAGFFQPVIQCGKVYRSWREDCPRRAAHPGRGADKRNR